MSYVITGLPAAPFQPLFGLSEAELHERGVIRYAVTEPMGFPCRIGLEDAPVGSTVLLLNYEHQPAPTPYRATHAIFVREGADEPAPFVDQLPPALAARPFLSLRAFSAQGMMIDAELTPRDRLEATIEDLLARPRVAYLQAHYAGPGCYAARVERPALRAA
jgi:hypothetical protein